MKAYKENIETIYQPNVTVVGSPTIKDGVISGFSTSNYLVIPNSYKSNNAVYVFKFTTGSAFSAQQVVVHGEFLLNLEITTNQSVQFYNWGSKSSTTLFKANANTTYWIKVVISGTTKTYSYSIDGETFTDAVTITDSGIDTANTSYQFRLGLSSYNSSNPFLGSIDLNECYIKIDGENFWTGMIPKEINTYKAIKSNPIQSEIPNATIVGSPTVNNNVVSGFSASNYLIFPESFPSATSVEFLFKVNMSNYHGDWNVLIIPFDTNAPMGFSSSGKLALYNTSAWLQGATTYSTGVDIWIKLVFNGTSWKLYSLIDNSYTKYSLPALSNWSLEITWNTTTNPWQGSVYIAHSYKDTNEYFGGSIDLTQSYIKLNDKLWWSGTKSVTRYKYYAVGG